MNNRIDLLEFIVKSMKMFSNVENILVYDKKNDEYHIINELYHINSSNNKEFMIIEI